MRGCEEVSLPARLPVSLPPVWNCRIVQSWQPTTLHDTPAHPLPAHLPCLQCDAKNKCSKCERKFYVPDVCAKKCRPGKW